MKLRIAEKILPKLPGTYRRSTWKRACKRIWKACREKNARYKVRIAPETALAVVRNLH